MNKEFFYEKPSNAHATSVFEKVKPELKKNKENSNFLFSGRFTLASALSLLIVALLYFQNTSLIFNNSSSQDDLIKNNLLAELAALSPDELDLIENLDFYESLPDELLEKTTSEETL